MDKKAIVLFFVKFYGNTIRKLNSVAHACELGFGIKNSRHKANLD